MSGIRIGGLVSGLDTQSIVDSVLELEASKNTTIQEKKADLEEDVGVGVCGCSAGFAIQNMLPGRNGVP